MLVTPLEAAAPVVVAAPVDAAVALTVLLAALLVDVTPALPDAVVLLVTELVGDAEALVVEGAADALGVETAAELLPLLLPAVVPLGLPQAARSELANTPPPT